MMKRRSSARTHSRRLALFLIVLSSLSVTAAASCANIHRSMPPFQPDADAMMTSAQRRRRGDVVGDKPAPMSPRGGDLSSRAAKPPTATTTAAASTVGGRLRGALFPIYGHEVKKFFLIGSIKFFVIMALTLTRDNKDTMVVTSCGAEAIAFLKVSKMR